jgi:hypothetical protein
MIVGSTLIKEEVPKQIMMLVFGQQIKKLMEESSLDDDGFQDWLKWDGSTMLRLKGLGMYVKKFPCLLFSKLMQVNETPNKT